MRHLDFTIDFETCSLSANAAPMQVAVVPWRRDAVEDPFVMDEDGTLPEAQTSKWPEPSETVRWWADRSAAAKEAVTKGLAEPVQDVLIGVLDYIRNAAKALRLESICLWCQGMDVDIAILRNLCKKYDIDLENTVAHTEFRDCRTIILEGAMVKAMQMHKKATEDYPELAGDGKPCFLRLPDMAYKVFAPLPSRYAAGSEAHDALYDAMRSSWYTWQALKSLQP